MASPKTSIRKENISYYDFFFIDRIVFHAFTSQDLEQIRLRTVLQKEELEGGTVQLKIKLEDALKELDRARQDQTVSIK